MTCGSIQWWRWTSTTATSPWPSSRPTATSSAPRPRSAWTWPGCPPPLVTGGCGSPSPALSPLQRQHGARAVVMEDLDFAAVRAEGRERYGSRPSRGSRGGLSAAGLRHPHRQAPRPADPDGSNAACRSSSSIPPTPPAGEPSTGCGRCGSTTEGDRSPRGGAGDRATRARAPGQAPRDREPDRPGGGGMASPGAAPDHPAPETAPRKPATPRDPRQPPGAKTGWPHRSTAGNQAAQDRPGPPARHDYVALVQ